MEPEKLNIAKANFTNLTGFSFLMNNIENILSRWKSWKIYKRTSELLHGHIMTLCFIFCFSNRLLGIFHWVG